MVRKARPKKNRRQPEPERPSPISRIDKIASLKRYADKDKALDLLHQIARAVAPIIHAYNFKVGTLCEMYPKSQSLLGLNVNRGEKILIRLRSARNDRTFLPMGDLIGTLLHELTHNVHGPHDQKFYEFLAELRRKYETRDFLLENYVCEENRLGSARVNHRSTPQSVRQKRLDVLSKGKRKPETRRIGGKYVSPADIRKAMLDAAEQRLRDSKTCSEDHGSVVDLGMESDDLEIQELPSFDITTTPLEGSKSPLPTPGGASKYKEVVDLTMEETGDTDSDEDLKIISVDACDRDVSDEPRRSLRPSILEESTFSTVSGNFEMRSTVRYYVSSSPDSLPGAPVESPKSLLVGAPAPSQNLRDPPAEPTEVLQNELVNNEHKDKNLIPGHIEPEEPGNDTSNHNTTKKTSRSRIMKETKKRPTAKKSISKRSPSPKTAEDKKPKQKKKSTTRGKAKTSETTGEENTVSRRKSVRCVSFQDLFLN
ncbi:hypothetical protein JCM33374_g1419 [Metschnikowia sp. JCM 33374]|nr:hypothetical protein JCM33374_g1419 [Metschnikowia sp. JCM 33374]